MRSYKLYIYLEATITDPLYIVVTFAAFRASTIYIFSNTKRVRDRVSLTDILNLIRGNKNVTIQVTVYLRKGSNYKNCKVKDIVY